MRQNGPPSDDFDDDFGDNYEDTFFTQIDELVAASTNTVRHDSQDRFAPLKAQSTNDNKSRSSYKERAGRSDVIEIEDESGTDVEFIAKSNGKAVQPQIKRPAEVIRPTIQPKINAFATFGGAVASVSRQADGSTSSKACIESVAQNSRTDLLNSMPSVSRLVQKSSKNPTKQWDQSKYAATGRIQGNTSRKKKGRGEEQCSSDEISEEDFESPLFPKPAPHPIGPPPSMRLKPDRDECKTWIYPLNKPLRSYQFNIVKSCLLNNCLVALPTGLGKTFIASVVMLNYYRWFPKGKVVFVAPTKPLVAQQIEACHSIAGIPAEHTIELTGQTVSLKRTKFWNERRVFFMTPQTFFSDLNNGNCDALDISMVVIDEAHKATGNFAYATCIRHLMRRNSHFRVLALTATPGGSTEAVQEIIDNLHISHIEIRDETALDLRAYMFTKKTEIFLVKLSPELENLQDKWAIVMRKFLKPLESIGVSHWNPISLKPYTCLAKSRTMSKNEGALTWTLLRLGEMARAMMYLQEESVKMFLSSITDLQKSSVSANPLPTALRSGVENILAEAARMQKLRPVVHPKMERMQEILLDHFKPTADFDPEDTRVMIFCQYRDAVDEIVSFLSSSKPVLRATPFVGQSAGKSSGKGMSQKEQTATILAFKKGDFNIMVATSIGEEGLDIGEVDLIIAYDAQKSSVKMLQRIGRTGRKRDGKIAVIMCDGSESKNWDQAKSNYKDVQRSIIDGSKLELFDDVDRMIPSDCEPECVQKVVDVVEFVKEDASAKQSRSQLTEAKLKKQKTARDVPPGATRGFVTASRLIKSGKRSSSTDSSENEFEASDLDISAGLDVLIPKRIPTLQSTETRSTGSSHSKKSSASLSKKRMKPQWRMDDDFSDGSADVSGKVSASPPRSRAKFSKDQKRAQSSLELVSQKPSAKMTQTSSNNDRWMLSSSDDCEEPKIASVCSAPKPIPDPTGSVAVHDKENLMTQDSPIVRKAGRRVRAGIKNPIPNEPSSPSSDPLNTNKSIPVSSRNVKASAVPLSQNPLVDIEAEVSSTYSESSEHEFIESEGDKLFIAGSDSPEKLATGYNQDRAYALGMMTQVGHFDAPLFSRPPVRNPEAFRLKIGNQRIQSSPEPNQAPNSWDDYDLDDGFCVDDDAEIVMESSQT